MPSRKTFGVLSVLALGLQSCRCFPISPQAKGSWPIVTSPSDEKLRYSAVRPFQTSFHGLSMAKDAESSAVAIERPDPSILLSGQPDNVQKLGFIAICLTIGAGSVLSVPLVRFLDTVVTGGDPGIATLTLLPGFLGFAFTAAGVSHFALKDTFTSIVPPKGTWGGLWQIPAPGAEQLGLTYEEYHNYWSGLVEIACGLWLIYGAATQTPQIPAFLLMLLTIIVTPANIYMATHDAQAPPIPPIPYPWGHVARLSVQCLLIAVYYYISTL